MSRTDAHKPYWVTAEWYEADHHYRCAYSTSWYAGYTGADRQPCDLPARAVRRRPLLVRRARRQIPDGETRCSWIPQWKPGSWQTPPPRWFIEHVWHNRERRRERDELRAAAAEYRATGDVDNDPAPRQARHCAAWLWD